jgi:hypothetical protein
VYIEWECIGENKRVGEYKSGSVSICLWRREEGEEKRKINVNKRKEKEKKNILHSFKQQ